MEKRLYPGTETGSCNVNICPLANVCQLRLDFSKFDISQPSAETSLTLAVKSLNGVISRKFTNVQLELWGYKRDVTAAGEQKKVSSSVSYNIVALIRLSQVTSTKE